MISAALEPQQVRSQLPPATESPMAPVLSTGGKALLPVVRQNPNRKKVLFVTSEIADLVKTGGLGDVSSALPRAMAGLHDVRVLIPGYPQVMNSLRHRDHTHGLP